MNGPESTQNAPWTHTISTKQLWQVKKFRHKKQNALRKILLFCRRQTLRFVYWQKVEALGILFNMTNTQHVVLCALFIAPFIVFPFVNGNFCVSIRPFNANNANSYTGPHTDSMERLAQEIAMLFLSHLIHIRISLFDHKLVDCITMSSLLSFFACANFLIPFSVHVFGKFSSPMFQTIF